MSKLYEKIIYILILVRKNRRKKYKKRLAFLKKTWVIFFEKETDTCVYVDKYVEKRVFCVKNDMFSIKKEGKMWITFCGKEK